MDGHLYNLLRAATEKADEVRMYDTYIADSQACEECKELWQQLKEKDTQSLDKIKKVLFSQIKNKEI